MRLLITSLFFLYSGNALAQLYTLEQEIFTQDSTRLFLGSSTCQEGEYLMASALNDLSALGETANTKYAGSVCVYKKSGDQYVFHQKIAQNDKIIGDRFGSAIAMHDSFAVVGVPHKREADSSKAPKLGAVYIFKLKEDGFWRQVQKIEPPVKQNGSQFGSVVCISSFFMAVAAPSTHLMNYRNKGGDMLAAGMVFTYRLEKGIWQLQDSIKPAPSNYNTNFGASLQFNDMDLLIGYPHEDEYMDDHSIGSVLVYSSDPKGRWHFNQRLTPTDRKDYVPIFVRDAFGTVIATKKNYLIVSSIRKDMSPLNTDPMRDAGTVYVFKKDKNGYWNEIDQVAPKDRAKGDYFGYSLSMGDGYFAVGAAEKKMLYKDQMQHKAGAVYIFKEEPSGRWIESQKVVPHDFNSQGIEKLGTSVALISNRLILGVPHKTYILGERQKVPGAGCIYIYRLK